MDFHRAQTTYGQLGLQQRPPVIQVSGRFSVYLRCFMSVRQEFVVNMLRSVVEPYALFIRGEQYLAPPWGLVLSPS